MSDVQTTTDRDRGRVAVRRGQWRAVIGAAASGTIALIFGIFALTTSGGEPAALGAGAIALVVGVALFGFGLSGFTKLLRVATGGRRAPRAAAPVQEGPRRHWMSKYLQK